MGPRNAPLFSLTIKDLSVARSEVSFGYSETKVAEVMFLIIENGKLGAQSPPGWPKPRTSQGLYAQSVVVEFPQGEFKERVSHVYIGPDGIDFDNTVRFDLAGLTATLEDVGFRGPFNEDGAFTAQQATFEVDALSVTLTGLTVPLSDWPSATGGSVTSDYVCLDLDGDLQVSANEISVPHFSLKSPCEDPSISVDFPGMRIGRNVVEIYDAPPLDIYGVGLDFDRALFDSDGFSTNFGELVLADLGSIRLRDLRIGQGGLRIGGGGFDLYGFGCDISTSEVADAWCMNASVSGVPVVGSASLGFCIDDGGGFRLTGGRIPDVTYGPVRIRNTVVCTSTNCNDEELCPRESCNTEGMIYVGSLIGFGGLPNIGGHVILQNGNLEEIGLKTDFIDLPLGGFPLVALPNGTVLVLLNSVKGTIGFSDLTVRAEASLCLAQVVSIPRMEEKRSLAGANGSALVSGQGYVRADADVRIFPVYDLNTGEWTGGIPLANGTAIAGRVYRDNSYQGTGIWAVGNLDYLGFMTARGETWAYVSGDLGAILEGTLKVPGWVPIIGGESFAGTRMAYLDSVFRGDVWFAICTPPIYYPCGIEMCHDCVGKKWWRVCFNYPCGVRWCSFRYCPKFRFGVTIDDSGPHIKRDEKGFVKFDRGYSTGTGMTVLTNYRLRAEKYYSEDSEPSRDPSLKGKLVIPYDLEGEVREMVFPYQCEDLGQDVHISLRFPDGRIFTRSNVPAFGTTELDTAPDLGDMLLLYRHTRYQDPEKALARQEAAFVCKGPYILETKEILDQNGMPTGVTEQVFGPGPLPEGRYEIMVESKGKLGEGKLDVLEGNQLPELTYSRVEPVSQQEPFKYRATWAAEDLNGDEVVVRVHLAANADTPEDSFLLGNPDGYFSASGEGSYEFDMRDPAIAALHLTGLYHVMISLEDRQSKEDIPDNRQYFEVGMVLAPPPVNSAPKVTEVVAVAGDGSAEVYWTPSGEEELDLKENMELVAYAVTAEEIGPEGTTGRPITTIVPAVHEVLDWKGEVTKFWTPTEAQVSGLTNGRRYQMTVTPMVHETNITKDGEIRVTENPGEPSEACLLMPTGNGNNAPRFLSTPPPVAVLEELYRYVVRVEDLDGDPVNVTLASMDPIIRPEVEPPKAEVLFPDLNLARTGNPYEWELTFTPTLAKEAELVGQWNVQLLAEDSPTGYTATQKYVVSVARYDSAPLRANIDSEPDLSVHVGETFNYRVRVSGLPDEYPVAFFLYDSPEGMLIEEENGLVTWTPVEEDIGTHSVTVAVGEWGPGTEGAGCPTCGVSTSGAIATQTFQLSVLENPAIAYAPVLGVSPMEKQVSAEGGELSLQVSNLGLGTLHWNASVSVSAEWLSISGDASGTNAGDIALEALPNRTVSPREGTVFVSSPDTRVTSKEVRIVQSAPVSVHISVQPKLNYVESAGGTATLQVRCDSPNPVSWSSAVSLGSEWAQIAAGASGYGDGVIELTCGPNLSRCQRLARVEVWVADSNDVVSVEILQSSEGEGEGEGEGEDEGESEGEGEGEGNLPATHTADQNGDRQINLSELLRVIQFYNSGGLHCQAGTEDGYGPGPGADHSCAPHGCDYNPADWNISLSELLRLIQFYNSGGYHACTDGEDGYCPGLV